MPLFGIAQVAGWLGSSDTVFALASIGYMAISAGNEGRFTVPFADRVLGTPFLGACGQLMQPTRTYFMYASFWVLTLALKVSGYIGYRRLHRYWRSHSR